MVEPRKDVRSAIDIFNRYAIPSAEKHDYVNAIAVANDILDEIRGTPYEGIVTRAIEKWEYQKELRENIVDKVAAAHELDEARPEDIDRRLKKALNSMERPETIEGEEFEDLRTRLGDVKVRKESQKMLYNLGGQWKGERDRFKGVFTKADEIQKIVNQAKELADAAEEKFDQSKLERAIARMRQAAELCLEDPEEFQNQLREIQPLIQRYEYDYEKIFSLFGITEKGRAFPFTEQKLNYFKDDVEVKRDDFDALAARLRMYSFDPSSKGELSELHKKLKDRYKLDPWAKKILGRKIDIDELETIEQTYNIDKITDEEELRKVANELKSLLNGLKAEYKVEMGEAVRKKMETDFNDSKVSIPEIIDAVEAARTPALDAVLKRWSKDYADKETEEVRKELAEETASNNPDEIKKALRKARTDTLDIALVESTAESERSRRYGGLIEKYKGTHQQKAREVRDRYRGRPITGHRHWGSGGIGKIGFIADAGEWIGLERNPIETFGNLAATLITIWLVVYNIVGPILDTFSFFIPFMNVLEIPIYLIAIIILHPFIKSILYPIKRDLHIIMGDPYWYETERKRKEEEAAPPRVAPPIAPPPVERGEEKEEVPPREREELHPPAVREEPLPPAEPRRSYIPSRKPAAMLGPGRGSEVRQLPAGEEPKRLYPGSLPPGRETGSGPKRLYPGSLRGGQEPDRGPKRLYPGALPGGGGKLQPTSRSLRSYEQSENRENKESVREDDPGIEGRINKKISEGESAMKNKDTDKLRRIVADLSNGITKVRKANLTPEKKEEYVAMIKRARNKFAKYCSENGEVFSAGTK